MLGDLAMPADCRMKANIGHPRLCHGLRCWPLRPSIALGGRGIIHSPFFLHSSFSEISTLARPGLPGD